MNLDVGLNEFVAAFVLKAVPLLGVALLDFLWQGLLVAAVYAALRKLMSGAAPAARVVLGQTAMLAFVLLPLSSFIAGWQRSAVGEATDGLGSGAALEVVMAGAQSIGARIDSDWLVWLVSGWLAGVTVLGGRMLVQWLRLCRLCREATPLEQDWIPVLDRLAADMGVGRVIRLCESAQIDSPMLFGWLKPVIVLPVGLALGLPRDQVATLLMHELAHVRRMDFLFNLCEVAVKTLLYFHPAVHWLTRRLGEDRELACDDLVVRSGASRLSYAHALAHLAQTGLRGRGIVGQPAMSATAGVLLDRIGRIVESPETPPQTAIRSLEAVLLAGAAAVMLALTLYRPALAPNGDAAFRFSPTLNLDVPLYLLSTPVTFSERLWRPIPMRTPKAMIDAPAAVPDPEPAVLQAIDTPDLASQATPQPHEPAPALPADTVPLPPPAESARLQHGPNPTLLYRSLPVYPHAAQLDGIEGSVAISFSLDGNGRPINLRVEQSGPAGIFERSAKRALSRWRYAVGADHDRSMRLRHAFDFRLSEHGGETVDECQVVLGSRICR